MPKSKSRPTAKKVKIGVSIDPELMTWVIARTGPGSEFASVTHAFERGIRSLIEKERALGGAAPGASSGLSINVTEATSSRKPARRAARQDSG